MWKTSINTQLNDFILKENFRMCKSALNSIEVKFGTEAKLTVEIWVAAVTQEQSEIFFSEFFLGQEWTEAATVH